MKKNVQQIIKYIFSYLYLILGYSFIIYFLSYNIRIANKLEGWAVLIVLVLMCLIVYLIINHLLIKKVLSNKLLINIEILLIVSIITLIISDFRYEEYLHIKYIRSTMPVIATPVSGY